MTDTWGGYVFNLQSQKCEFSSYAPAIVVEVRWLMVFCKALIHPLPYVPQELVPHLKFILLA